MSTDRNEPSTPTRTELVSVATMTDQLLVTAKPSDSVTTVIHYGDGPYYSSMNLCGANGSKCGVDSKCSFVNICNHMNECEPDRLHELPTPKQSCLCTRKPQMRYGNGQWAMQQLRELNGSRSKSDMFYALKGNYNSIDFFCIICILKLR